MENLVNLLFETKALKISPQDKPFWLTSGLLSPYYINTQFLYGSEAKANELLSFIEIAKEDILNCPTEIYKKIAENYEQDKIYKQVVDMVVDYVHANIDLTEIQYISGGERRDWFFSMPVANLLNIPHITIYKDQTTVVSNPDFTENTNISDLKQAKVLHIADLITEASSYERAWIPAIKNLNATIVSSLAIVDRLQGGTELLNSNNIDSYSLIQVNESLFDKAIAIGAINKEQYDMLLDFMHDPIGCMKEFIKNHPEFMEGQLNSADEKTVKRAQLCQEKGFYN